MAPYAPENLKIIKDWQRPETLFSVVQSETRVFAGASDANVYQFDVTADQPEPQVFSGHEGYVTGLAMASGGLVSAASDGRLIWWDTETRQRLRTVDAHTKWIRRLTVTPDGQTVASVGDDMVCRLWEGTSGSLLHELRGHQLKTPHHFPSMLYAVAMSANGEHLATADRVGHIVVWEVKSGKQVAQLEAPVMYTWDPKQRIHSIGGARSLAFSPDGRLLAVGGMGPVGNIDHLEGLARIEVFDWKQAERTLELPGDTYKGLVERLCFDPQGRWLIATGGDHTGFLKFIDATSGNILKQEAVPMHVHDMVLDPASGSLITVGNQHLIVWSLSM